MSDIHAVLLIPAEGDPHGLLREGPCGARPPIATKCVCGRWECRDPAHRDGTIRALVLAWEGEVLRRGCEPVVEALEDCDDSPGLRIVMRSVREALAGTPRGRWLLPKYAAALGCTLVLLDADGREVTC